MAKIKFPALREDDYWSEIINEGAVALFQGIYLGYNFKMTYNFNSRKWQEEIHDIPDDILKLLKWELHQYELWLPDEEPPADL